jgi:hypothetical protein
MEQLEEDAVALDGMLARQVKLLYLAQDELLAGAKKQQNEPLATLAALAGNGYGAVAQVLLTLKNAGPRVEKLLRTEKIAVLRELLFAVQSVLNAAADFELLLTGAAHEQVESPEFLFKANVEPIVAALAMFKKVIPTFVPNGVGLSYVIRAIIADIAIAIEPSYEERLGLAA